MLKLISLGSRILFQGSSMVTKLSKGSHLKYSLQSNNESRDIQFRGQLYQIIHFEVHQVGRVVSIVVGTNETGATAGSTT